MPRTILSAEFFERRTLLVAKSLLGKYLVRKSGDGLLAGRIVEVEAYVGPEDRASHASRGRTPRTDVMFGPPGIAYVYLIYGMYHCFNVVTEREDYPAAILIRAVEVEERLVGGGGARLAGSSPTLIDGPGKLCRRFEISREQNRHDLTLGRHLWLEDRGEGAPSRIVAGPRIGVDYAGDWAKKPWRFRLQSTGVTGRSKKAGK